jgi:hypothetical protein
MATTIIAKIAARAKQIRAKSPSMTWITALKKAGAEFRGTTKTTTSKRPAVKAKRKLVVKKKSKVGAAKKTPTKKQPATKHKDTKSHNVNIRVMSGAKKPKLQKTDIDMSALNGIIKFQARKFYEVVKGPNKGSVVKITSMIKKPVNDKYNSYNVDFYEFRNGVLQKPFLAIITENWLNKRSIRPRPMVKPSEFKKYI